jgi:hypothetical protein
MNRNTNVKIGQHNCKRVQTFNFLRPIINDKNTNSNKILTRIKKGNKALFRDKKVLSSKLIRKQTKIKIYKTTVRPIETYASNNWTSKLKDINHIKIFEKRILRKIFGSIQERDGWKLRILHELNKLTGGANMVRSIKAQTLKC